MIAQASFLAAAFVGTVAAQVHWPVPTDLTGSFCDGLIRPDWDECEENYLKWFIDAEPVTVGPDFGDGVVFTGEKCQIRYIQGTNSGSEFEIEEAGMYDLVRNACEGSNAGGVQRQADLLCVVEDPSNPFILELPDNKRNVIDKKEVIVDEDNVKETVAEVVAEVKTGRSHARDIAVERDYIDAEVSRRALEGRQSSECSGSGACYEYVEGSKAVNIRGQEFRVCNDVLPDGASCTNSRSVTVTQGYTAEINVGSDLTNAINVGASFSGSYSEGVTTTLSTTITVDCDGGSGYIVWYPLVERSTGQCIEGTCRDGWCQDPSTSQCSSDRPYVPSDGSLSGEYDVQCI